MVSVKVDSFLSISEPKPLPTSCSLDGFVLGAIPEKGKRGNLGKEIFLDNVVIVLTIAAALGLQ